MVGLLLCCLSHVFAFFANQTISRKHHPSSGVVFFKIRYIPSASNTLRMARIHSSLVLPLLPSPSLPQELPSSFLHQTCLQMDCYCFCCLQPLRLPNPVLRMEVVNQTSLYIEFCAWVCWFTLICEHNQVAIKGTHLHYQTCHPHRILHRRQSLPLEGVCHQSSWDHRTDRLNLIFDQMHDVYAIRQWLM